ncbi:MAG: hypothetical protein J3Q66DRAFT_443368 [Benniella sp.]|nr:MAG: hypothetical protein J3Q66DRAFT_443368 [Benniella sp.]
MTDITEIDDIIFGRLDPCDLARCILVSKKWHAIVVPYLWYDLSFLEKSSDSQRQAFNKLVLEDYLQEHRYQEPGESDRSSEQPSQPLSSISVLSKYAPMVRLLTDYIRPRPVNIKIQRQQQPLTRQDNEPTEHMLLLHLLKRCPSAKVSTFHLDYSQYGPDDEKTIVQTVLPRVRHLSIQTLFNNDIERFSKLKGLLIRCPTMLEKLTLEVDCMMYREEGSEEDEKDEEDEDDEDEEEPEVTEQNNWRSLKELALRPRGCTDRLERKSFWSWLFKRCGEVEKLEVSKIRGTTDLRLREAMLVHMPKLQGIILGHDIADDPFAPYLKNDRATVLLDGSHHGWKSVRLKETVRFGDSTRLALEGHFGTLEELYLDRGFRGLTGRDLPCVLSLSPNLHTLVDDDQNLYENSIFSRCEAALFIEERNWACKSTLKVLKIKLHGIPRPDLEGGVDIYGGLGRQLQSHVYDRLAQLTNLEILWLGNRSTKTNAARKEVMKDQLDCLEMSLESGLDKLSELKSLEELSVSGMTTRIGVKEVQWMAEHWPSLRIVYGLSIGRERDAVEWLEHHPRIEVLELQ